MSYRILMLIRPGVNVITKWVEVSKENDRLIQVGRTGRSVPRAVATGSGHGKVGVEMIVNPVATALGTD
jgi:hypothetical protein